MPRHRNTKGRAYDPKVITDAVKLVQGGQSVCQAAKHCGVPKTTLLRWITNPPSKLGSGGSTVLSEAD